MKMKIIGIIVIAALAAAAVIVLPVQSAKAQARTAADGKSAFPGDFHLARVAHNTYVLGSPANEPNRKGGEPQRPVVLTRNFYIGKYPVTIFEYTRVMNTAAVRRWLNPNAAVGGTYLGSARNGLHPMEMVTWWEAIAYCNERSRLEGLTPPYTITRNSRGYNEVTWNRNANGYRLPTEAEWEIACRAGTTTAYSFGNTLTDRQANFGTWDSRSRYTGRGYTTAVGSFPANPWGIYDMHGNVWEWCWDWYEFYGDQWGRDKAPWTARRENPTGPSRRPATDFTTVGPDFPISDLRVVKGGSWNERVEDCRSARRAGLNEYYFDGEEMMAPFYEIRAAQSGVVGFRIVRNAQ